MRSPRFATLPRTRKELGVDGTRLAAAGDSAGGTLAAAAALTFRDQGGPRLRLQALIYPVTDMTLDSPAYARIPTGYTLPRERMLFFREAYLRGPEDIADWRASPLKARDLSNLPPALVLTAAQDPLVDEGKAYADRLACRRRAGDLHLLRGHGARLSDPGRSDRCRARGNCRSRCRAQGRVRQLLNLYTRGVRHPDREDS